MDNDSVQSFISSEIQKLPQKAHIPIERAKRFMDKILKNNPKADLKWQIDRMAGIGGSESAAILNHYYKSATNFEIDNEVDFKNANDVSLEKLMLSVPLQIPQADRGNRIEGMIRDIFMTRYSLFNCRDEKAMEAAKRNANNPFMVGNVDDVFYKSKRILVDYKSSNSHLEKVKYSHTVQLNHYQENMRSNDMEADLSVIATLSAPEEVLMEFVKLFEERKDRPEDYAYFVNSISNNKFSFAKLTVNPVQTSPEFGKLISDSVYRFMNEFPLAGKTVSAKKRETVLVGEDLSEAEEISKQIFQVMSAEQAITQVKQALTIKAKKLTERIECEFEWPVEDIPINVTTSTINNYQAGIDALELNGFEVNNIYKVSEEVDVDLLIKKHLEIGGVIDEQVLKKSIDKEKYQNALSKIGLNEETFKTNEGVKFNFSRKVAFQDQIYSTQINMHSKIIDFVHESIIEDQVNRQESLSSF